MRKAFVALVALVCLLVGAGVAYATTTNLQSGGTVDHVLVEQYANGGSSVGPGNVGESAVCPQDYYVTGGGWDYSYASGGYTHGFRASYNGPVSGWGSMGTAWSVTGDADVAGTFRVWAICIKLT